MKAFWVAKLDWQQNNKIQLMEQNAATKLLSVVNTGAGKAENSIIAHKERIKVVSKDSIVKWRTQTSFQLHSRTNPDKSEMFPAKFFPFAAFHDCRAAWQRKDEDFHRKFTKPELCCWHFPCFASGLRRELCLVKQWPLKLDSCWSMIQLWWKTSRIALDTVFFAFQRAAALPDSCFAKEGQKHCTANL